MKAIITALDDATEKMQSAIVSQDLKVIWEVLSEQERIAAEFQQCACLWGHLASAGRGNPEIERSISEMDRSFECVRRKNRCNMALIKSYLGSVERALRSTGTSNARKLSVYGRHGKMQYRQSSIALSKEG
jgi:hypothetical protein